MFKTKNNLYLWLVLSVLKFSVMGEGGGCWVLGCWCFPSSLSVVTAILDYVAEGVSYTSMHMLLSITISVIMPRLMDNLLYKEHHHLSFQSIVRLNHKCWCASLTQTSTCHLSSDGWQTVSLWLVCQCHPYFILSRFSFCDIVIVILAKPDISVNFQVFV